MEHGHSEELRQEYLMIYSDAFKEAFGYRPRGDAFPSEASMEEIQAELDYLYKLARSRAEEEAEEEPTVYSLFYGEE